MAKENSESRGFMIAAYGVTIAALALVAWAVTALPIALAIVPARISFTAKLAIYGGSYVAWVAIATILMWRRVWVRRRGNS